MTESFGAYFAILPALPTIPPSQLKTICDSLQVQGLEFWTHHRIVELIHPQLEDPLQYLEISAKISSQSVANDIIHSLLQRTSEIGNAEILLVLPDTPIPLLPIHVPTAVLQDTDSHSDDNRSINNNLTVASNLFQHYGLVVLPRATSEEVVEKMYQHAIQQFQALYQALQKHDSTSTSSTKPQKHFSEIMTRDPLRFDFVLDGNSSSSSSSLCQQLEQEGSWKRVVRDILGPTHCLVKCGCVLSLPSCGVQYWHSDGVHLGISADFSSNDAASTHALCVFVPLIDLTESTGCTEFWAGSHKYSKLLQKDGEQSLPGGTFAYLKKGDALLYDYRTIHRGTGNSSPYARPICYFLYAREGYEHVEDQNFRTQSVFDLSQIDQQPN